jgi:RNA-directed DNA polymerase
VDATTFEEIVNDPSRSTFYQRHEIPKRGQPEKTRVVWEVPKGHALDGHKAFARRVQSFIRLVEARYPHAAAFGYVRRRGIVDNARQHCGAPLLLRADIRAFFPSINASRIAQCFSRLGVSADMSQALARFCTIDDVLPLGLHASPTIANLVCLDLDDELSQLAEQLSCRYTRYADDITFSGSAGLPTKSQIKSILGSHDFDLSPKKFRVTKLGQAHYVTGLSVSDPAGPHVPRAMRRQLRLILHYCQKFGVVDHLQREDRGTIQGGVNSIDGLVRYVSYVERRMGEQTRKTWSELLDAEMLAPSYRAYGEKLYERLTMVIDETEFSYNGRNYMAIAVAVTEQVDLLRDSIKALERTNRTDPFAAGRPERIDEKGLHFTDLHETLRQKFAEFLESEPVRGYVAFAPLTKPNEYTDTYLKLLETLLGRRLIAADRATVDIEFEVNPKVKQTAVAALVKKVYGRLEARNSRRPVALPQVTKAEKLTHPEVAVPDFLLGTLKRYLIPGEHTVDLDRLRFERLRDKYRVIVDLERDVEYTRRWPILPWTKDHSPSNKPMNADKGP